MIFTDIVAALPPTVTDGTISSLTECSRERSLLYLYGPRNGAALRQNKAEVIAVFGC